MLLLKKTDSGKYSRLILLLNKFDHTCLFNLLRSISHPFPVRWMSCLSYHLDHGSFQTQSKFSSMFKFTSFTFIVNQKLNYSQLSHVYTTWNGTVNFQTDTPKPFYSYLLSKIQNNLDFITLEETRFLLQYHWECTTSNDLLKTVTFFRFFYRKRS